MEAAPCTCHPWIIKERLWCGKRVERWQLYYIILPGLKICRGLALFMLGSPPSLLYEQDCKLKFRLRELTSCLCSTAASAVCFEVHVADLDSKTGHELSQPTFEFTSLFMKQHLCIFFLRGSGIKNEHSTSNQIRWDPSIPSFRLMRLRGGRET